MASSKMIRPVHRRLRLGSTFTLGVATLAFYAILNTPAVAAKPTRARRLNEIQGCQPNAVPHEERCTYVRTHRACRPEDGWIPYLEVHYCYLSQMEVGTTALFLIWIAILFGLMLMVAERFFCPSLELISEYLRLPPCVAGATLLSFGNGAPDVFTQLAAISQGDSEHSSPGAVAMALSEPLGSGLFVGNIVFGLVVLFSGLNEVRIQRSYFLKDCLFYFGGVAIVFGFLIHGEVMVWEVALLACYYLAFIVVTVLLSRGDEPVHADPRLHEVPHRLKPLDSYLRESFHRVRDLSTASQDTDADTEAPLLGNAHPKPRTQSTQQHQLHQQQWTRGPVLERIEESGPALSGEWGADNGCSGDGGDTAARATASGGGDGDDSDSDGDDQYFDLEVLDQLRGATTSCGGGRHCGANYLIGSSGGGRAGSSRQGLRDYMPPQPVLTATAAVAEPQLQPPPALLPSPFYATGRSLSGDSTDVASASYRQCGNYGRGSLDVTPSMRREVSGKTPGRFELLWRRVERPGLALLSLFMPRVAIDTHARYRKTCAVLLPPLLPTLVGWAQGWLDAEHSRGGFWRQGWWLAATGAGLLAAVLALTFYPRKGHLHGVAAGIATVVVFGEAMFLLDASAGELVSAAVALGQIFGISPSLLGATLLAWGNSVSDLVSNITLAKDGLPSMAITACFASPMFVLLAGLVTSLTYATRHGDMQLPHDLALKVLYGCSSSILLMWALVVPLVFRFRLTRKVGVLAVTVYLIYQSIYIWAVVHDSRD